MTEHRRRKPRYVPVPPDIARVEIQPRDAELIRHVYKHRFLRTGQIVALVRPLFPGQYGEDMIKRRLRKLFDEGYVRRPASQHRFLRPGNGNPENVYAIGNQGADVLERWYGIERGKIDWSWKNNKVGEEHIEHTLLVADVMVAIEIACRNSASVNLLEADAIVSRAPEKTRTDKNFLKWRVATDHFGKEWQLPIHPDQAFGLEFIESRTCAHFFLEADRGTMTVEPAVKAPWKSSIYRKFVGYHATWQQKVHMERFGIKTFRTLFVVQTKWAALRVRNFLRANRNAIDGTGFTGFLFSDYDTLLSGPILEAPWINGRGEITNLLE